jgi:hypothetical protein
MPLSRAERAPPVPVVVRKRGRHRRPKSLRYLVRRISRALRSARSVALLCILGLFVIATAVMAFR